MSSNETLMDRLEHCEAELEDTNNALSKLVQEGDALQDEDFEEHLNFLLLKTEQLTGEINTIIGAIEIPQPEL